MASPETTGEAPPPAQRPVGRGNVPLAPASRRRMTWWRRALFAVATPALDLFARGGWRTLRFHVTGDEHARALAEAGRPAVLCLWHRDIPSGLWVLRRLQRLGMQTGVLISPSIDGEVPARTAMGWGIHVVRGSSTRTGVRAMLGMHRAVEEGVSVLTVPDGPRGPELRLKVGAVMLAQRTGVPLLPITCTPRACWRLGSWDRMRVPWFFSRVDVAIGAPIEVTEGGPEALERVRAATEEVMRRASGDVDPAPASD